MIFKTSKYKIVRKAVSKDIVNFVNPKLDIRNNGYQEKSTYPINEAVLCD